MFQFTGSCNRSASTISFVWCPQRHRSHRICVYGICRVARAQRLSKLPRPTLIVHRASKPPQNRRICADLAPKPSFTRMRGSATTIRLLTHPDYLPTALSEVAVSGRSSERLLPPSMASSINHTIVCAVSGWTSQEFRRRYCGPATTRSSTPWVRKSFLSSPAQAR